MSYQKSTEQTIMFKMVDSTDFATPVTSASPVIEISKDAGAFAASTNSAVEVSDGWYKITLTAAEMDAEEIIIKATAAGAAQSDRVVSTESITSAVTEIKGTGFVESTHSLASRPLSSGGGGHCAWFDEDLNRANKFFKSFPKQFKEFESKFTSLKTKLSHDTTDSEQNLKLNEIAGIVYTIHDSMTAMQNGLNTTDKLLLEMASESSVEAILDG